MLAAIVVIAVMITTSPLPFPLTSPAQSFSCTVRPKPWQAGSAEACLEGGVRGLEGFRLMDLRLRFEKVWGPLQMILRGGGAIWPPLYWNERPPAYSNGEPPGSESFCFRSRQFRLEENQSGKGPLSVSGWRPQSGNLHNKTLVG